MGAATLRERDLNFTLYWRITEEYVGRYVPNGAKTYEERYGKDIFSSRFARILFASRTVSFEKRDMRVSGLADRILQRPE